MRMLLPTLAALVSCTQAAGGADGGVTAPSSSSSASASSWLSSSSPAASSAVASSGEAGSSSGAPAFSLDPDAPPFAGAAHWTPAVTDTWQIQLLVVDWDTGPDTSFNVHAYDLDLFELPAGLVQQLHAAGRKVLCYFSAGSFEDWRPDAAAFDDVVKGQDLQGWPGERWLDIRSPSLLPLMRARLDRAVTLGCDAVDPDNVDAYAQPAGATGFPLTARDQLAYNRWLANEAHARGLAVGLKNDLDQVVELVAYFDFAVNEECHAYAECDALAPFPAAARPVFNIEYPSPGTAQAAATLAAAVCPDALARELRTLVLPPDLDGSFRVSCD